MLLMTPKHELNGKEVKQKLGCARSKSKEQPANKSPSDQGDTGTTLTLGNVEHSSYRMQSNQRVYVRSGIARYSVVELARYTPSVRCKYLYR